MQLLRYFSNCFVCISVQLQYTLLLLQLWLVLVCCYAIVRVFWVVARVSLCSF